jgi:PTS system glucitol/sorbitol-specific IIC component
MPDFNQQPRPEGQGILFLIKHFFQDLIFVTRPESPFSSQVFDKKPLAENWDKTAKKKFFPERTVKSVGRLFAAFGRKLYPGLKKIAPPLLLGSILFILLFWTGLGDMIGNELSELTGPVPALLIIFAVSLIPVLSSALGPGLLIVIAAGILAGEQIAGKAATPVFSLAALCAFDAQIGWSFIPPSHVLGENEPETINAGVPAVVFTRLVILPIAVVLTALFSF